MTVRTTATTIMMTMKTPTMRLTMRVRCLLGLDGAALTGVPVVTVLVVCVDVDVVFLVVTVVLLVVTVVLFVVLDVVDVEDV